jgi:hypothetical protein
MFYSHEWRERIDVCSSMIKYRLGLRSRTVFARDCKIEVISSQLARDFVHKNHLSGDPSSGRISLGLYTKEKELVSVMTFKDVKKNANERIRGFLEIKRFTSKMDVTVVGGLSKILSYVKKELMKGYRGIMTFVDCRVGSGKGYKNAGMSYLKTNNLSYGYTEGKIFHYRFRFRATEELSEIEVAEKSGVFQVPGAGNHVLVWDNPSWTQDPENKIHAELTTTCKECNLLVTSNRSLSNHIKSVHQMTWFDYLLKYEHNGVHPVCKHLGCTEKVPYVRYFYSYCNEHRDEHRISSAGMTFTRKKEGDK